MPKTVQISDETHGLIKKRRDEIYNTYKINLKISDIADRLIRNGTDKIEEAFNINSEKA